MSTVYVQNVTIPLSSATPSSNGKITGTASYTFPSAISSAAASVASFFVSYGSNDHDVLAVGAAVSVTVTSGSSTVTVSGTLQLEDDASHYLDPSSCSLQASVIAIAAS